MATYILKRWPGTGPTDLKIVWAGSFERTSQANAYFAALIVAKDVVGEMIPCHHHATRANDNGSVI